MPPISLIPAGYASPSCFVDKGAHRFVRDARAQVAELVDALVSGTSDASRGGSSPLLGTSFSEKTQNLQMVPSWFRALAVAAILAPFVAAGTAASDESDLLARARTEGQVSFYNSVDIEVAERVKQAFEARYPGIKVSVERNGAQRLFQRLSHDYESGIFNADVVNSADAAHFVLWAKRGWLAAYLPEEVTKYYDKANYDPGGRYGTWKASLSVVGYNRK